MSTLGVWGHSKGLNGLSREASNIFWACAWEQLMVHLQRTKPVHAFRLDTHSSRAEHHGRVLYRGEPVHMIGVFATAVVANCKWRA